MSTKCPKCQTNNPENSKFCKECATPLPGIQEAIHTKTLETPIEELTTGSTFAQRYQIIEELGKGGMGKVYRVLDKKLNEEVALKLIKPDIAADKKTIERFKNELKLARKIRQKNVGSMYELLEEKGLHFITMEYVSGQDLKGLIHQTGQLTVGKAISIAKQICYGLEEAHSLGIVHRDLKPNNIMIDRNGNARIMDFGIARAVKGKSITGSGVLIGTPQYMSPEQVEGKDVDLRSDIYSLGIILYEMLTDRVPFEGDTPLTIGVKQKTETPKDPKDFNERIPDDLNHLILKCLEKEKENRYQSVGEVMSELVRLEQGLPTTDRVIPKKKPLTSKEFTVTFGMKKFLIPAIIAAALIVLFLFIWSPWSKKETISVSLEIPSIVVLPFDDLSPNNEQGVFCVGFAESLITALTKITNLRVSGFESSLFLQGKELNFQEIGRELNVKTVLHGSVYKADDMVRITVHLTNIADKSFIWSENWTLKMDDVFVIHDEITLAIVDNLKIQLLGEERQALIKKPTDNPEAFSLYAAGRVKMRKRGRTNLLDAIDDFKLALDEDSNYALAYSGIADSYFLLATNGILSANACFPEAKKAVKRALELDDELAEAHTSLAAIMWAYEWNWDGAKEEFKRAIRINPRYAEAHHWYSLFLRSMGIFDEAIREIELARNLDPLYVRINANIAHVYNGAGLYDKALDAWKKAKEKFNLSEVSYPVISYIGKEMYKEALELNEEYNSQFYEGIIYAKMGKTVEARQILNSLIQREKQEYINSINLARLAFAVEDKDLGFKWLNQAYENRDPSLRVIKIDSFFDSVRSDSKFIAFMKKMNLD